MHELGIIVHVMRTVEEVAAENNVTEIRSVTCEVGEVSGVVPAYLTDCWEYARKKSELFKDAELIIEIIPGVTVCEDCGKTYYTVAYAKICPHCGSGHTVLLEGNGFNIKEIEGA